MATRIAVIGNGNIGKHVVRTASRYGHEAALVVTRKGIIEGTRAISPLSGLSPQAAAHVVAEVCEDRKVGYALLAIPSGGDGVAESCYIQSLLNAGVGVVTAGKSALANRFDDIKGGLDHIGFDASLGGGTGIPSFLERFLYVDPGHPFVLTAVVNGTLNYAQSRVREGASAEQICDEALRLGYAEPPENGDALDPLAMYRGEIPDVCRKIAIACNTRMHSLAGRTVTQADFHPTDFTGDDLARVMAGNSMYVYLVRFCLNERDLEFFQEITLGGRITAQIGHVFIAGGFVKLEGALTTWVPSHVKNAAHLIQGGDMNKTDGYGAGPVPTVGAMMMNLRDLIKRR